MQVGKSYHLVLLAGCMIAAVMGLGNLPVSHGGGVSTTIQSPVQGEQTQTPIGGANQDPEVQIEPSLVVIDETTELFPDTDVLGPGDGRGGDCNGNGVDDAQDISGPTSEDCNTNAIPDECDISWGTSADMNGNWVPDECEDCDGDGITDDLEILYLAEPDCNENGIPDVCEVAELDCNENGVPDDCDISEGTSQDANGNGTPDECDPAADCNLNGVPDDLDITGGTSADCDGDQVPDECQYTPFMGGAFGLDCDANGTLDVCQGAEFAADCDNDGMADGCAVALGKVPDCNDNDIPDECDIDGDTAEDCNCNEVPDICDISSGVSLDTNFDNVPDECDEDCDEDGRNDGCEIYRFGETDNNLNRIPDGCETTCVTAKGDANGDCFINAGDIARFGDCDTGAVGPTDPPEYDFGCECLDMDSDGDVDGTDYGLLLDNLQEPGAPPLCCPESWSTFNAPETTNFNFTNCPIPAGFFCAGSPSYDEPFPLSGYASPFVQSELSSNTVMDTEVTSPKPQPAGVGDCDKVPARVSSLSMGGSRPLYSPCGPDPDDCNDNGVDDGVEIGNDPGLDLNYNGLLDQCEWLVRVTLSESVPAPLGSLTACQTHSNGGKFSTEVFIAPVFIFSRLSDVYAGVTPETHLLEYDCGSQFIELVFEDLPYSTTVTADEVYTQACNDGFYAGVDTTPRGDPDDDCVDAYDVWLDYDQAYVQMKVYTVFGALGRAGVFITGATVAKVYDECRTGLYNYSKGSIRGGEAGERGGRGSQPPSTTCALHMTDDEAHGFCPPECFPADRCAYSVKGQLTVEGNCTVDDCPDFPDEAYGGTCTALEIEISGAEADDGHVNLTFVRPVGLSDLECDTPMDINCPGETLLVTSGEVAVDGMDALDLAQTLVAELTADNAQRGGTFVFSLGLGSTIIVEETSGMFQPLLVVSHEEMGDASGCSGNNGMVVDLSDQANCTVQNVSDGVDGNEAAASTGTGFDFEIVQRGGTCNDAYALVAACTNGVGYCIQYYDPASAVCEDIPGICCDCDNQEETCGAYPDCNGNGTADICEIDDNPSLDCNGNDALDICEVGMGAQDCDLNGEPDECQLASGSWDCNTNGLLDEECDGIVHSICPLFDEPNMCEVELNGEPDCNSNGVPDSCDILQGTSSDLNGDGVPDECEWNCDQVPDPPPVILEMVEIPDVPAEPGGPAYTYLISKYEVSLAEFVEFLNSAYENQDDIRGAHLQFHTSGDYQGNIGLTGYVEGEPAVRGVFDMSLNQDGTLPGDPLKLTFSPAQGYAVVPGYETHPVVGVTWIGAAKFCNWLTLMTPETCDLNNLPYHEGPYVGSWHPATISTLDWWGWDPAVHDEAHPEDSRDLTDDGGLNERYDLVHDYAGFRLPMDGGSALIGDYNEWYKAAAFDAVNGPADPRTEHGVEVPALHWVYGPATDNPEGMIEPDPNINYLNIFNPQEVVGRQDPRFYPEDDNAFGLYHVSGNVWELIQDKKAPNLHPKRGGSGASANAQLVSLANRERSQGVYVPSQWTGFRVVRVAGE